MIAFGDRMSKTKISLQTHGHTTSLAHPVAEGDHAYPDFLFLFFQPHDTHVIFTMIIYYNSGLQPEKAFLGIPRAMP